MAFVHASRIPEGLWRSSAAAWISPTKTLTFQMSGRGQTCETRRETSDESLDRNVPGVPEELDTLQQVLISGNQTADWSHEFLQLQQSYWTHPSTCVHVNQSTPPPGGLTQRPSLTDWLLGVSAWWGRSSHWTRLSLSLTATWGHSCKQQVSTHTHTHMLGNAFFLKYGD